MNGLALCAGYGGIELGLRLAIGPTYRTVCYVEREAYAAGILVARMEDGTLDTAPLWDDLTAFDGEPWRGVVDCVTAGFPCQPFSVAGERRKTDDERWIWPSIAGILRAVRPRYVFLENVPGLLSGGIEHVLADLAALGLAAQWDCFRASDVGAPHRRERLFILGVADPGGARTGMGELGDGGWGRQPSASGQPSRLRQGDGEALAAGAHPAGRAVADTPGSRRTGAEDARADYRDASQDWGWRQELERGGGRLGVGLADAQGIGQREPDHQGSTITREHPRQGISRGSGGLEQFPPAPNDIAGWNAYLRAGGPQPAVRRGVDGIAHRVDRLRSGGNGVVPDVAALAWRVLWGRMMAYVTEATA